MSTCMCLHTAENVRGLAINWVDAFNIACIFTFTTCAQSKMHFAHVVVPTHAHQFVCECNHEQERASEFAESCLLVVLESDPICESLRLHMYMRTLCVCPHHDWRNVACACPSTEHAWMQVCIYYIIHDDNAVGTPVVSIGDCPESLLTGSVPYLERIKIHHTSSR